MEHFTEQQLTLKTWVHKTLNARKSRELNLSIYVTNKTEK